MAEFGTYFRDKRDDTCGIGGAMTAGIVALGNEDVCSGGYSVACFLFLVTR